MVASLIVRHGAVRFLGEFDPEDGRYRRGDEVVIRTDRGLEIGQVLGEASPRPSITSTVRPRAESCASSPTGTGRNAIA